VAAAGLSGFATPGSVAGLSPRGLELGRRFRFGPWLASRLTSSPSPNPANRATCATLSPAPRSRCATCASSRRWSLTESFSWSSRVRHRSRSSAARSARSGSLSRTRNSRSRASGPSDFTGGAVGRGTAVDASLDAAFGAEAGLATTSGVVGGALTDGTSAGPDAVPSSVEERAGARAASSSSRLPRSAGPVTAAPAVTTAPVLNAAPTDAARLAPDPAEPRPAAGDSGVIAVGPAWRPRVAPDIVCVGSVIGSVDFGRGEGTVGESTTGRGSDAAWVEVGAACGCGDRGVGSGVLS
jgi:hypothetical protein